MQPIIANPPHDCNASSATLQKSLTTILQFHGFMQGAYLHGTVATGEIPQSGSNISYPAMFARRLWTSAYRLVGTIRGIGAPCPSRWRRRGCRCSFPRGVRTCTGTRRTSPARRRRPSGFQGPVRKGLEVGLFELEVGLGMVADGALLGRAFCLDDRAAVAALPFVRADPAATGGIPQSGSNISHPAMSQLRTLRCLNFAPCDVPTSHPAKFRVRTLRCPNFAPCEVREALVGSSPSACRCHPSGLHASVSFQLSNLG